MSKVMIGLINPNEIAFRIHKANGKIKYAGTGKDSWFTLEDARKKADTKKGEMIYEYNLKTMNPMWEIL